MNNKRNRINRVINVVNLQSYNITSSFAVNSNHSSVFIPNHAHLLAQTTDVILLISIFKIQELTT